MISERLRCTLALLCFTVFISCASAAPSDAKLRQMLQRSLLVPTGKQDVIRFTLAELLSEIAQAENEALDTDAAQDDMRVELERATDPVLAPRERKAGCKNFFWKTFTSC
ncbi:somatostatin 1, tandem duplicate 1 [Lampris incognitus]|uniref:somatostatin 1, tandem duplicate 1 n=1 Tax=Lampris incognitus TaxID=2546036 RepID=UPI0024B4E15F|nr:somatostatin 1, tandem duplicate 1 [Lampris incognitus]